MRLLIKQRVFSWTDSYDVYDENENAKYFVKAEFFSLGHQLHIYDRNDRELGVIRQRLFTLLPAFEIEIGGQVKGEIRKQFSFSNPDTRLIITAGAWKEIFWDGIMMYTTDAAVSFISPRNCSIGEIPTRLTLLILRTNWKG